MTPRAKEAGLPPHSIECEQGVLGCVLLGGGDTLDLARLQIPDRSFFFDHRHRAIWSMCCELVDNLIPIDLITLPQRLKDKSQLEVVGGVAYLNALVDSVPSAANLAYYLDLGLETWQRRRLAQAAAELAARCLDPQSDFNALLGKFKRATAPLGDESSAAHVTPLDDLLAFDADSDPNCLIGSRWVCRGGSLLQVGPAGIGKSTLAMQQAICWAIGRPFVGVTPMRPLKSLVIQAENDIGDLSEQFRGVVEGLGLDLEEVLPMLKRNLVFVRDQVHTGHEFCQSVRKLIAQHKPDLVWLDPLLSFIGDDISKQVVCSQFLRNWLNPIAEETGVCWVMMHHTGKPPKDAKSDATTSDLSYIGIGSSELVNWARAVTVLRPHDDDTFELLFAKRGRRAGAIAFDGQFSTRIYLSHASQGLFWGRVATPTPSEDKNATTGQKRSKLGPSKNGQHHEEAPKRRGQPSKVGLNDDELIAYLDSFPGMPNGEKVEKVQAEFGVSRATAWRLLKKTSTAPASTTALSQPPTDPEF